MLVTSKELLLKAQEGGYAVGAFNVENMEMVQAVLEAAEELNSPVIMQTTPSTVKYAGLDYYLANVEAAAKRTKVPVVMHLDHGNSFELAMQAYRTGYTSIMIDGSHESFEDNIAVSKAVADACHPGKVPVEAELGKVGGKEDDLDGGDDNPGGNDEPTGTPVSRADAIKYQKSKIASLKLDLQESDIKISQLEKKANKKLITAKLDGTVTYVGDSGSGETTDGKALIKIKSSDGFYVVGSVSELMLDDFKEGTKLNCTSYTSGSFEADVMDVSEYPVTGNSFYGSSNPNVSYYAFTAVVSDKTLQLEDQDWVTVNYEASAAENIMVIQKAFVRNDNNKNYVYKDDNGILKKQEISVGAAVDSGYSVIVKGGLSEDDLIAFPYGKDVKEGAKTKEVTLDQMYGY